MRALSGDRERRVIEAAEKVARAEKTRAAFLAAAREEFVAAPSGETAMTYLADLANAEQRFRATTLETGAVVIEAMTGVDPMKLAERVAEGDINLFAVGIDPRTGEFAVVGDDGEMKPIGETEFADLVGDPEKTAVGDSKIEGIDLDFVAEPDRPKSPPHPDKGAMD